MKTYSSLRRKSSRNAAIESRDDALKVIKEASTAFFVVAALQGAIGAFLMPSLILDGVLYAVLALLLRWWKSRTIAILLLLLATIGVVTTLLSLLGVAQLGGHNIFLAAVVLWAAIRGVQATFLYWGKFATPSAPSSEPLSF